MSMIKQIEIDDKQVSFKASAAIPRIYRMKFQRDIYKDLKALGFHCRPQCLSARRHEWQ